MTTRAEARAAAIQAMEPQEREYALGRLQGELYTSVNGVAQQARRLREEGQAGSEYLADGRSLAYFLRDAIRIAEVCGIVEQPERAEVIKEAIARVDAAVPGAVDARNALEHCDDYILGVGHKQKDDGDRDFAQRYVRRSPPIVQVGDITIDVNRAEGAAQHLLSVVALGADPLDLLPTARVDG